MAQLPIKDIVSDVLRLSVREPRVFVTLSWVSLLVSTAMFMRAYLAQDRTAKKVLAAIACIFQKAFNTESLYRLMEQVSGHGPPISISIGETAKRIRTLLEQILGTIRNMEGRHIFERTTKPLSPRLCFDWAHCCPGFAINECLPTVPGKTGEPNG